MACGARRAGFEHVIARSYACSWWSSSELCGGVSTTSAVAADAVGSVLTSTVLLGLCVALLGTGIAVLFAVVQACWTSRSRGCCT